MKKQLHALLTLLLLLVSRGSIFAQTTITFNPIRDKGTQVTEDSSVVSKDGVTITTDCGNLAANSDTQEYRFYAHSKSTIVSTVGNITKVVITSSNDKYYRAGALDVLSGGRLNFNKDKTIATWTGKATSLTFKASQQVRGIKIEVTVDISNMPATISSAGWSTFVTKCPISFNDTSVKAYTARYDPTANTITLSPVAKVPANTAVVLKGNAGTYSFTSIARADALANNDLTFKNAAYKVTSDKTYYVLARQGDVCGFYPLASGETLPAYKGYIYIQNASSAKTFYAFGGTTTGISRAVGEKVRHGVRYSLSGQRVSGSYKGVVIENGKKFVVK